MSAAVVELLRAGRERIVRGWTQGVYARGSDGDGRACRSPEAVCWCAVGALLASTPPDGSVGEAVKALNAVVPGGQVAQWNDRETTTQSDVLIIYSLAIAAAEAQS